LSFFRVFVNLFQFNRTNWKAVALCFITATIFWFFSALNKNHTTNIRFPLQFQFDQDKYTPSSTLPPEITLNVSGNGWDLFRKHFGLKVPTLHVNLEKPAETRGIAGASVLSGLASQLNNLKINFVVTDSLRIHLEEKVSKKFKVAADLSNLTFKKGFGRISPVVILPDSVTLTGPKSRIRGRIDSIVLSLDQKKIDKNFREQIEVLTSETDFIHRNPPVVEVIFEVGSMIEEQRWIKIKIKNPNWGTELERDSIRATFQLPQKNSEAFRTTTIDAILDLSPVKKGETKYLTPRIEELPRWTELIQIDSVKVKRY